MKTLTFSKAGAILGALSITITPCLAHAAVVVWTLHGGQLQSDQRYPQFTATLTGDFTVNATTGALESYQFYTSTAVVDFGGGSAFFSGAPFPGPVPGANIDTSSGCFSSFCFYGPPQASASSTSVNVGYADDEPQSGYLPLYVTHTLDLNFSGPLTTPGTIDLLNSSSEYNGSHGFRRQVISGYATGVSVPEPATWAMMLIGFGALGATMRSHRKPSVAAV